MGSRIECGGATMRAAIYARKSTEQDVPDEAKSVKTQKTGARAFCKTREWDVVAAYADDGVSGALFEGRPAFQKMMRAAEAHAFDAVVVHSLDRLGRETEKTRAALYQLADLGVAVWAYSTGRAVDIDSFEGGILLDFETRFGQWYRDSIRRKTKDAMRAKAARGEPTGKPPYGYGNVTVEGRKVLAIHEPEAEVVREIYRRFAAGQGVGSIVRWLNSTGTKAPVGERGWASTTVRRMLRRLEYRGGEREYGKTERVYGREAPKGKEEAQVRVEDESKWLRVARPDLRIVDEATVAKVDRRLAENSERDHAAKAAGRAPHKGKGRHLLSGGLLVCPDCGGNFEARTKGWGGRGVYVCAARRHRPGTCPNKLALEIAMTDAAVLNVLRDQVLGGEYIDELLSRQESAPADDGARLAAERDRLKGEVDNLVRSVAKGMPAETIAPVVRQYEVEIAKLEATLARPRPVPRSREDLRAGLEQSQRNWRELLLGEMDVARAAVRRLIGPITLSEFRTEPVEPGVVVPEHLRQGRGEGLEDIGPDVVRWDAEVRADALAEGLVETPVRRSAGPR
jgi:DNA invertase Pin-like site-specific DNA recombinase